MINSRVAPETPRTNIREDATTKPKDSSDIQSDPIDTSFTTDNIASRRKSSKKDDVSSIVVATGYRTYPRRFLIAFVVCMANLVNAAMWTKVRFDIQPSTNRFLCHFKFYFHIVWLDYTFCSNLLRDIII